MIQKFSILNVADNSGALFVNCICILNKKKFQAIIGDELVVTVRSVFRRKRVNIGDIVFAVLVRQKKWFNRDNGVNFSFCKSAVILIQLNNRSLLGNRIKGPVTYELRKKKYLKIICLANIII